MSHCLNDNFFLDCMMKTQGDFIEAPINVIRHNITIVFLLLNSSKKILGNIYGEKEVYAGRFQCSFCERQFSRKFTQAIYTLVISRKFRSLPC